ncbi:MAG: DHHA1 domain-containing protein, partial [Acidimicrobiia bacterium]
ITDTQYAIPARLVLQRLRVSAGELAEGDVVTLAIDGDRRDAIRRNHTATHLLHSALREVLGSHVKQAGSHVDDQRLRFDFSHHEAVAPEDLVRIEAIANREVISDAPVRHYETTKAHAESVGAIAFFGDKYGDIVRVLEAGPISTELCGGTHVHALGFIGPVKIVSEGSIGSNLRRIEAVTGAVALDRVASEEQQLRDVATQLNVAPGEIGDRVEKLLAQVKAANDELAAVRRRESAAVARGLVDGASGTTVVTRHDGLGPDDLRQVAVAVRDGLGADGIVVVIGVNAGKAGVVVAVGKDRVAGGISAAELAAPVAKLLGGGTAKNAELVVGGGPNVNAVDDALVMARDLVADAVW